MRYLTPPLQAGKLKMSENPLKNYPINIGLHHHCQVVKENISAKCGQNLTSLGQIIEVTALF